MKKVITWSSPVGMKINICKKCQKRLEKRGEWPRDWQGQEYCQVAVGLHRGHCDICEKEKEE